MDTQQYRKKPAAEERPPVAVLQRMPAGADALSQVLRFALGDDPYRGGAIQIGWLPRGDGFIARYRHLRACPGDRQRQLHSAPNAKLFVDMMQAHLHGAFGQMELAGDFLVAQATDYKLRDVAFAWR
jgi:hypothetical protein